MGVTYKTRERMKDIPEILYSDVKPEAKGDIMDFEPRNFCYLCDSQITLMRRSYMLHVTGPSSGAWWRRSLPFCDITCREVWLAASLLEGKSCR